MKPAVILPVCVCKPIFLSFCSKTRGDERGVPSSVLSSFGTRKFPTTRLSEIANACRKRQCFVGNNKALSANLSVAEKNLRRSI
jgi:hypothetical protein